MTRQAEYLDRLRRESWSEGRSLEEALLAEYCRRYRPAAAPPPAKIADQLITDPFE